MKDKKTKQQGITLLPLISLVVGSAIGGGIFGIMADLSGSAGAPTIFSWLLVGGSMLMLALTIYNLNTKRPDLSSGIYSYAEAGFGRFSGLISGWGYWLTSWLGNVAFATLLMSALGYFFPILHGGQNTASVILSTVFLWLYAWLVNRGVESASIVNAIVTICKLVPLFIFVVVALFSFKMDIFIENFSSLNILDATGTPVSFNKQVLTCIMVMLWVFVGIEGASTVASRARKKSDVGKATVMGLISLLIIYMLISLLPYGILSTEQLASIRTQPAMGYLFELMVGKWGAVLINGGLIISLIGVWLSWTILPVETMRNMAKDGLLPAGWQKVNRKGSPTFAIILTTVCTNLFLLSLLVTDQAYNFAYTLGTAAIFFTWLYSGLYQMKLSYQRKEWGQLAVGAIISAFLIWAIIFVALKEVMLVTILFIPGVFCFLYAQKQQGIKISEKRFEHLLVILVSLVGFISLTLFATGVLVL
ncbi:basic amino acid/polyamine antiporter [Enterococcus mediterraneensis]|uniref:basic amino acid/polyamine antiporter n=1 Tax=Enterococcus mediterraneensis TaxID=2364791 RepID=UPI000F055BFE|nr:basic amino acid/polyamine antiporter [Enterococcus mediterraneensis]